MAEWKSEVHKIAPASFLGLGVIALFGDVICSGTTLCGSDFLVYFYPIKRFIFDHVWATGSIPLWNPYVFSGTPIIANIQASMFYPLGFLYYLIAPDRAYLYSTILHCILAALFMYVFVRSLGVSRSGAFLSGSIFALNGYFIAHIYAGHLSFVQNYIWIPLVFFFAVKIGDRNLKYAIAGGLVFGVQVLGGFPQLAFYSLLAILLLSLYRCCSKWSQQGLRAVARICVATLLLSLVGFLVAAIQLMPTYEFSRLSTRAGGVDYEFATMDSFPPTHLLTFLFPLLFGSPVDGTYWINNPPWQFWEYCGYIGISSLALILVASRKLVRDRTGRFFLLLSAAALFLSLGKYNPLYPLIYRLPGFNSFRIPAQILFLYVFSFSVLSGMAIDRLNDAGMLSERGSRVLAILLFVCLPLVIGVYLFPEILSGLIRAHIETLRIDGKHLTRIISIIGGSVFSSYCILFVFSLCWFLKSKGSLPRGIIKGIWIGLVVVDLWAFVSPMVKNVDIGGLKRQAEELPQVITGPASGRTVINGRCFIENTGLWYGFHDIQGYDPLILRRYMEYINKSQGLPPDNKVVNLHYVRDVANPLIRMLNLQYVVDCEASAVRVLEDPGPRCRVVHQAIVLSPDNILDMLSNQDRFDPLKAVILEDMSARVEISVSGSMQPDNSTCRITGYEPDRIDLSCRMKSAGYLILSEINYPGWQAYVDGEERTVLTGNYLFRTIYLEPGNHEVTFVFKPSSFRIGAAISMASVVGIVIFLLVSSLRKRRDHQGGGPLTRFKTNDRS
ncbi:MAG: YfhO family protein [candidate division WOR-3 bacterium]